MRKVIVILACAFGSIVPYELMLSVGHSTTFASGVGGLVGGVVGVLAGPIYDAWRDIFSITPRR